MGDALLNWLKLTAVPRLRARRAVDHRQSPPPSPRLLPCCSRSAFSSRTSEIPAQAPATSADALPPGSRRRSHRRHQPGWETAPVGQAPSGSVGPPSLLTRAVHHLRRRGARRAARSADTPPDPAAMHAGRRLRLENSLGSCSPRTRAAAHRPGLDLGLAARASLSPPPSMRGDGDPPSCRRSTRSAPCRTSSRCPAAPAAPPPLVPAGPARSSSRPAPRAAALTDKLR